MHRSRGHGPAVVIEQATVRDLVAMTHVRFHDAASGLLTRDAFTFMVDYQLKHAQRTQEFLTLVVIVVEREWRELVIAADEWIVREVGRLVRYAVRNTDLVSLTTDSRLSLLLLGIDTEHVQAVLARINEQITRYGTVPALHISVGVACCPTHAICAEDLLRHALATKSAAFEPRTQDHSGTTRDRSDKERKRP